MVLDTKNTKGTKEHEAGRLRIKIKSLNRGEHREH